MRRKLFFILLSLTTFMNTSSCITPPPGGCAYNDTNEVGSIEVISIEEYQGDMLNCKAGKIVKFKFISNNTKPETIYNQVYPGEFILSNKIEVGKNFKGIKQYKFTGPCRDDLFTFSDFPDSFGLLCEK